MSAVCICFVISDQYWGVALLISETRGECIASW